MPVTSNPTRGTRPNAFGAYVGDLGPVGYFEAEYLVSGEATGSDDGEVPDRTAPFTTRIFVRAPIQRSRFNGTVVVEWLNVSGGHDMSVGWPTFEPFLTREGYAFVGVTAQPIGALHLRRWDPVRYAAVRHPWQAEGPLPSFVIGETLSDGVFATAGRLVRDHGEMLFGAPPRRLVAYGQSQSCGRVGGFIGTVANASPERNPYDAFFMHGGSAGSIATSLRREASRSPLEDVRVPVLHLNSEAEAMSGLGAPLDHACYRYWEVAGAGHAPARTLFAARRQFARDFAGTERAERINAPMEYPDPVVGVEDAAIAGLAHLDRWAGGGEPPPMCARLMIGHELEPRQVQLGDRLVTRRQVELTRDEHGHARGGVRLPQVEVPTGRHLAVNGENRNFGGFVEFVPAALAALYPTADDYVRRVREACAVAVEEGFVLPADAERIQQEAARRFA